MTFRVTELGLSGGPSAPLVTLIDSTTASDTCSLTLTEAAALFILTVVSATADTASLTLTESAAVTTSVTQQVTQLGADGLSRPYVAITDKAETLFFTIDVTDTAFLNGTEQPFDSVFITTPDTASLQTTDTVVSLPTLVSGVDSANITLNESTAVGASAVTSVAASDTTSLHLTDTAAIALTVSATDTTSLQAADSAATSITGTSVTATDTASLSVSEVVSTTSFVGSLSVSAGDTASISVLDSAIATPAAPVRTPRRRQFIVHRRN